MRRVLEEAFQELQRANLARTITVGLKLDYPAYHV